MTPKEKQRELLVLQYFERSLDLEGSDSEQFFEALPGEIREELELLRAHTTLDEEGGTQLDRFRLVRELGSGKFGTVYLAKDTMLGRDVALKIPKGDAVWFFREAEAAANLRHQYIVPVFEIDQFEDGRWFMASEYVEGRSLRELVNERNTLPPKEVATLVSKLADAVGYAHSRRVIHCDLKPENIIIDGQGAPQITDWGIARQIKGDPTQTQFNAILGSPAYMSPEQAAGERARVDEHTDVWALGVVVYELLTGRRPFQDFEEEAGNVRVLEAIKNLNVKPPRPAAIAAAIPRDLETICMKCLEKEPRKRYASARDLNADLIRFLKDEPITARRVTAAERLWRWSRRNPILASLLCLLAGLLIAWSITAFSLAAWALQEKDRANRKTRDESQARMRAVANAERAEERRKLARQKRYDAEMMLATRESEQGNATNVIEVLDGWKDVPRTDVDLRGFEWYYLYRRWNTNHFVLGGQDNAVLSIDFNHDGSRLVSGSEDGVVRIWDMVKRKRIMELRGHKEALFDVAYSPDGLDIASVSTDGIVKIWNATTGEEKVVLDENDTDIGTALAFAPDGRTLATVNAVGTVTMWDSKSGEHKATLKGIRPASFFGHMKSAVAFSPDGKRFSCTTVYGKIRVWDETNPDSPLEIQGDGDGVFDLQFGPDGKTLASGGMDKTVKLWDPASGDKQETLSGHRRAVVGIAFSPKDDRLATASEDGTLRIWDSKGRQLAVLQVGGNQLSGVAFSPDGRLIASGAEDGKIHVWNALSGRDCLSLDDDVDEEVSGLLEGVDVNLAGYLDLAICPDGTHVALSRSDGTLKLWDIATREKTVTFDVGTQVHALAFSPDRKVLAGTVGPNLCLWDVNTGEHLRVLPEEDSGGVLDRGFACFAFVGSGELACVAKGSPFRFWYADSDEDGFTLESEAGRIITTMAIGPKGRRIVAGDNAGIIALWDGQTGERVVNYRGHSRGITNVQFSPDGKLLASASVDGSVKSWDASTGDPLQDMSVRPDVVWCMAFSRKGERLIGGSENGIIRVWHTASGQELLRLPGHRDVIRGLGIRDGLLITAGDDGVAKIWDGRAGDFLGRTLR